MIDHERRFIFIHIQKTAGKSLLKALGLPSGADHRFATVQRADYGEKIWSEYFKFAIVRNPWDRLVSGYFYRLQGGSQSPDDKLRAKLYPRSFKKFCMNIQRFIDLPDEHMFVPQYEWITDKKSDIIIDYVGKFEDLQNSFDFICDRIGQERQQLPHANPSKRKHYYQYYDRKCIDHIAKIYTKDIEHFNYDFDIKSWANKRPFLHRLLNR